MSEPEAEREDELEVPGVPGKRGPGRPKGSRNKPKGDDAAPPPGFSPSRLKEKLNAPLLRIADWLEGRDPELAQALREDAGKIAGLLSKWAANPKAPPGVEQSIRFLSVVLEPIDAFGRVTRLLYIRWRNRRLARLAELPELPEEPERELELVPDQPEGVTPDRFRADREPPQVD